MDLIQYFIRFLLIIMEGDITVTSIISENNKLLLHITNFPKINDLLTFDLGDKPLLIAILWVIMWVMLGKSVRITRIRDKKL
ncbi:hypothetical protein MADA3029_460034 [Vibrio nigripulchritudo MADA3029]|nr:hypothetical protein VIBNIMADA3020_1250070 [Vibrio nigripulchritudo MADA3020]CCN55107.1 hypothetical protein VIBNIMADA3021_680070 [Vibrio nigripulchritudo MADA3021]CCN59663.1 hypothetical protein MADA3029_460034 [Vibrio nigripulchritudo MADA3029]